jgi:hypothetical protein
LCGNAARSRPFGYFCPNFCPNSRASRSSASARGRQSAEIVRLLATNRAEDVLLRRAADRLGQLSFYERPVDASRARVVFWPWLFRLPPFRRYRAYAFLRTIAFRSWADLTEDRVTHELCHTWQWQQRPLWAMWKWATSRYSTSPLEREARRAVELTR